MRLIPFLLFLLSGLAYTSWRIWLVLPFGTGWKWAAVAAWLLCFAAIFIHYGLGDRFPIGIAAATYEIGTSWLIAFLYVLMAFAALDLARLLHLIPGSLLKDSIAGTAIVAGSVSLILAGGWLHYHHKYREEITISSDKAPAKPLKIVLASDLHIGYHNRAKEISRWVDLINAESPDLVLFAGDVLDGSLRH